MAIGQLHIFSRVMAMVRHSVAVFRAKATPFYVKMILGLGLVYVVSPWDFIPEWVPVIGILDDFALAALLIAWANGFRVSADEHSADENSADENSADQQK